MACDSRAISLLQKQLTYVQSILMVIVKSNVNDLNVDIIRICEDLFLFFSISAIASHSPASDEYLDKSSHHRSKRDPHNIEIYL